MQPLQAIQDTEEPTSSQVHQTRLDKTAMIKKLGALNSTQLEDMYAKCITCYVEYTLSCLHEDIQKCRVSESGADSFDPRQIQIDPNTLNTHIINSFRELVKLPLSYTSSFYSGGGRFCNYTTEYYDTKIKPLCEENKILLKPISKPHEPTDKIRVDLTLDKTRTSKIGELVFNLFLYRETTDYQLTFSHTFTIIDCDELTQLVSFNNEL